MAWIPRAIFIKQGAMGYCLRTLQARLLLTVVAVFLGVLWSVLAYVASALTEELHATLWDQQYSVATVMAGTINRALDDRMAVLEATALTAPKDPATSMDVWQRFLAHRPVLLTQFNGGVLVHRKDGVAIANYPPAPERVGGNYRGIDVVTAALNEGRSSIGAPVVGTKLQTPVFGMAVPLRDSRGHIVGALTGVIDLGLPNFLGQVAAHGYAKSGWYFVVDPVKRQIVMSSDKSRIMEILPAPGINPAIDTALSGYEGMLTGVDKHGNERVMAVRRIPASGWVFAASMTTEEAYAPVHKLQQRLYAVGALATLLVGMVTAWLLRRQLAPLGQAVEGLRRMRSKGQAMHDLPIARLDEVGQLVEGINQMTHAVGQREAALREVQARLEGTLNAIPDLLFECDREHRIVGYRARRAELLVLKPEEFMGRRFSEVLPKEAADICEKALQQAEVHGYSGGLQYPLTNAGQVTWFELSVALKTQSSPAATTFVLLARDVTESRNTRDALQQSRDELRALANRLQNGREAQRAHFAREIHDVLAQELTRLKIDLSWMKRRLEAPVHDPMRENLLVRAGQAMDLVDSSITTVQRIATELRPVILDSLGLFAAVEWQVEDFSQRTGLQCSTTVPQRQDPPDRDIAIVLFRILQESLTNIARHAQATQVQVCLQREAGAWLLTIEDDGIGIQQEKIDAALSLGLLGMRERALAIGGSVQFSSRLGQGTTIVAQVPDPGENT